jgi:hypothetical protein
MWLTHCAHNDYDLEAVDGDYFDGIGLLSQLVADKGSRSRGSMALFRCRVRFLCEKEGPPMKRLIGDGIGFEKIGGGSILFTWNFFGITNKAFRGL